MGNAWDTELYEGRFSFVWRFGEELLGLLEAQPGERILDLGCGTGQLTGKIAESGATVIGLDSDPAMLAQARMNFPRMSFMLADARNFQLPEPVDAVFSNAALHWVLDAGAAVARIRAAIRPGGRFVAEFGGRGNVARVLSAVQAETGSDRHAWYYPSVGEYASLLEANGFRVTHAFDFDRDTALENGSSPADWLAMFGDALLAPIPPAGRKAAVERIVERLRPGLYRDGQWWIDYRRLRIRAVRES